MHVAGSKFVSWKRTSCQHWHTHDCGSIRGHALPPWRRINITLNNMSAVSLRGVMGRQRFWIRYNIMLRTLWFIKSLHLHQESYVLPSVCL